VVALVHQDSIFDDSKGGLLRAECYKRLRLVFRFKNEIKDLFPDVGHARPYACTVTLGRPWDDVDFSAISNVFHPSTIVRSFEHDGEGSVPGIKDDNDRFEVRGHRRRLVRVRKDELFLFAQLFDRSGTPPLEARLPLVHSQEVLSVLKKIAQHPCRLSDLGDAVLGAEMWHEKGSQDDGTIRKDTQFPGSPADWIVNGPHIYVGNPLSKTPLEVCNTKNAYSTIDLEGMPDDYLPRTNFVRACSPEKYKDRMPVFLGGPISDYYRHVNRRMLSIGGERTLIAAVIPPGCGHMSLVFSIAFKDQVVLARWNGFCCSLPLDFFVRVKGKSDLRQDTAWSLPIPRADGTWAGELASRSLRLNCLTVHYEELWNYAWKRSHSIGWSLSDVRLAPWPDSACRWRRSCALRNAFERRWALIEIDALAALEFGLTIDELCTIYRTQFPVLREYEKNTWYDRRGRIAFTTNRGLTGDVLDRKNLDLWQTCLQEGRPLSKDFDTMGLDPPFETRDREDDMRTAYAFFAEKLGKGTQA
jgi:hypothetical protein